MVINNALSRKTAAIGLSQSYQFTAYTPQVKEYVLSDSFQHAEDIFDQAVERLLNINGWNDLCNEEGNTYCLTDKYGNAKTGKAAEGDYIRIAQPEPDLVNGEVYIWMRIDKILNLRHDEWQSVAMRTSQCKNPTSREVENTNLFNKPPTTTFVVERNGHRVLATTRGQKQIGQPRRVKGVFNKMHQMFLDVVKILGNSKTDWDNLLDGLLQTH